MNTDPQAWQRLARALREARERAGLTQRDLATAADVSLTAVGDAETPKIPKARMPYTLAKIAQALEWPPGTVDAVLDGADPPGGWRQVPVQIDPEVVAGAMTRGMVAATDTTTAAQIRAAVTIALDELRRAGVVSETGDAQPDLTKTDD